MICSSEHSTFSSLEIFNLFYNREEGEIVQKEVDVIVSDGDGTLYAAPRDFEPEVDTSPAHQPIISWLKTGIRSALFQASQQHTFTHLFLLATGNEIKRTVRRFVRHIPPELRQGLLVNANGGAVLYYHDYQGVMHEDVNYRSHAIKGGTAIDQETASQIVEEGVHLINAFCDRMKKSEQLQEEFKTKAARYTFFIEMIIQREEPFNKDELLTHNNEVVPRIEVRSTDDGVVTQISLVGIPTFFEISSLERIAPHLEVFRMNLRTEINVKGVDKKLVLGYLGINPLRSFALGDRPDENDAPLTKYKVDVNGVKVRMPFVSVCEILHKVPEKLFPLHIGYNMEGAAKLIGELVSAAAQMEDETSSVIQNRLRDAIRIAQQALSR